MRLHGAIFAFADVASTMILGGIPLCTSLEQRLCVVLHPVLELMKNLWFVAFLDIFYASLDCLNMLKLSQIEQKVRSSMTQFERTTGKGHMQNLFAPHTSIVRWSRQKHPSLYTHLADALCVQVQRFQKLQEPSKLEIFGNVDHCVRVLCTKPSRSRIGSVCMPPSCCL